MAILIPYQLNIIVLVLKMQIALHKECVKSGWISQPGEMIVCLPFKLIININGQKNNGIDAGTF